MSKINTDFLLRLVNNNISKEEILTGYMRYYVAQGRNLGDIKNTWNISEKININARFNNKKVINIKKYFW